MDDQTNNQMERRNAYRDGYRAYLDRVERSVNPYADEEDLEQAWFEGYEDAGLDD